MGKLSPYARKEWQRKHSTSKEMRWLNKGIDAAFKGAGKTSTNVSGDTQEDWDRANLSKGQLRFAIVAGAVLPLLTLATLSEERFGGAFLLVEFFFFAIPFLGIMLVFMLFNIATRPKTQNKKKTPASECAESSSIKQVSNPAGDEYLVRWNNRKAPNIIELEMPEISFQTRYDFSKVRGFDFGMENNPISIFIDGKNQLVAKEDILQLNVFLSQGRVEDSDVPMFEISEATIRFEPSSLGMDDYTRLKILPLTPTGKKPKYPLEMDFCLMSQDEHWKLSQASGKEIFGQIWYLNSGEVGKARIICWNYAGKSSGCYIFQICRGKDGLFLQKVEKPVQPR